MYDSANTPRFSARQPRPPLSANVNCSPKAGTLNRRPALVLPRHAILAHREGRISSQGPNLIHRHFLAIKSGLECTLVELFNIRSWPIWIDVQATTCEER